MTAGCRDMALQEALSDPLIRAVMAADRVDPARLAAELAETARRLDRSLDSVASSVPSRHVRGRAASGSPDPGRPELAHSCRS
jgi:hypothetical protein